MNEQVWTGSESPDSGSSVEKPSGVEPPVAYTPQEPAKDDCDGDGACTNGCTTVLHSGEVRLDRVDLSVPGRGDVDFVFARRYRSRLGYDGPLGHGWTYCYNESLYVEANGDVVRFNGGGHLDRWTALGDGTYRPPRGHFRTLTSHSDEHFVLRSPSGFKRTYDGDGRLLEYRDRNDNVMTFTYDPDGNLSVVRDPYEREYTFAYEPMRDRTGHVRNRLVALRDFSGREVRYHYDAHGHLTEVRSPTVVGTSTGNDFPDGRRERYAYSSGYASPDLNHDLLSVTFPQEVADGGPPALSWRYGDDPSDPTSFGKVVSETIGGTNASGVPAGGTSTFDYKSLNDGVPLGDPRTHRGLVHVTGRNGNTWQFFANENGEHTLTLRQTRGLRPGEPAHYRTEFEYDEEGLVTRVLRPEGNECRTLYDTGGARAQRSNIVELREVADPVRGGGEDLVTRLTYEPLFNRVSSIIDPRGTATQYDPPSGSSSPQDRARRYRTAFIYDYQEHTDPVVEATRFGVDLTSVDRGLGDANGDGRVDQSRGNLVRIEEPEVERSNGAAVPTVTQVHWSDAGLPLFVIDPGGNLRQFEYGSLRDLNPALADEPSGYLRAVVEDVDVPPAPFVNRRSSTHPPTALRTSYEFNALGQLVRLENARGVSSRIEVTALDEVVRMTRGTSVDRARDEGQLLTTEEAARYEHLLFYDFNGRVVRRLMENRDDTTIAAGRFIVRTAVFDILGALVESTEPIDAATTATTRLRYDPDQLLVSVVQPEGNESRFEYDERNLLFRDIRGAGSPEPSVFRVDYDLNGNPVRVIEAADKDGDGTRETTRHEYDGFDRPVAAIDAYGSRSEVEYDVASAVVRSRMRGHPPGRPEAPQVLLSEERVSIDELQRIYEVSESLFLPEEMPLSGVSSTLDGVTGSLDPLVGETDALTVVTKVEYDALSRPTRVVSHNGETRQWEYDGVSRVVRSVDALGNQTLTDYDRNSNPVRLESREVSPDGITPEARFEQHQVYDQFDRIVRVTDNAGVTTRFEYDSRDNLTRRFDGNGPLIPDPMGLFSGQINGRGNSETRFYDARGRVVRQVFAPSGLPATARSATLSNPDGRIELAYRYDGNGNLTAIRDDGGNATRFEYDEHDRVVGRVHPNGASYRCTYDRDDNVRRIVDPNGSVMHMTYDRLGRLVELDCVPAAGVAGTLRQTFEYDGLSRLTALTDDNGGGGVHRSELAYDSLWRVIEERQDGQPVTSDFMADGERVRCRYPGGREIVREFDELDRVRQLSDAKGVIGRFSYIGPEFRELKRDFGNGSGLTYLNDAGGAADGYDAVARVVGARHHDAASGTISEREYEYDRVDNRLSERRLEDGGVADRYRYDGHNRLVDVTYDEGATGSGSRETIRTTYEYDGVGNRRLARSVDRDGSSREEAYAANAVNEYSRVGSTDLAHDRNGNLTDDGSHKLVYDPMNRLVAVWRKTDRRLLAEYFYHADNRRARKVQYDRDEGPTPTHYLYDGWQVCEERDGAGATLVTYAYGPGYVDSVIQMERTPAHPLGEGSFFIHQNPRSDVIAVTDRHGAVAERRVYDAFGRAYDEQKQPVTDSGVGMPYGFQGRRIDPETGFYYFRSRYYDPTSGRFLQRDPVWDAGNDGGWHTFVGNNPATGQDPAGLHHDLVVRVVVDGKQVLFRRFRSGNAPAHILRGFGCAPGGQLTFPAQQWSHTERKALRWLYKMDGKGRVPQNARIVFEGTKPPCRTGQSCRHWMNRFHYDTGRQVEYRWGKRLQKFWRSKGIFTVRAPRRLDFFQFRRTPVQGQPRIRRMPLRLPRLPARLPIPRLPRGGGPLAVAGVALTLGMTASEARAAEARVLAGGGTQQDAERVKAVTTSAILLPDATNAALNPELGESVAGLTVANLAEHGGLDGPSDWADYWTGRISGDEWIHRRFSIQHRAKQIDQLINAVVDWWNKPSPTPSPSPKLGLGMSGASIASIGQNTYVGSGPPSR